MRIGRLVTAALLAAAAATPARAQETAVFAGGCFWGIEAVFEHVKGVTEAVSGYAGGTVERPSYELVSTGMTGHAESVRVTYDPARVSYEQLLEIFFAEHDPTQLDRQGPDTGTQYRSMVLFTTPEQERAAKAMIEKMTAAHRFPRAIVTEVRPLAKFFPAEEYHQNYLIHHKLQPYIVINDLPKVADLAKRFPALYRE